MKKILFLLIFFSAIAECYYIQSFFSDITIYPDGEIRVAEKITVDFEDEIRHGIFRYIPVKYKTKTGGNYLLSMKVISVTNELGEAQKYKVFKKSKNVYIKIGDPDKTISGVHTYMITYSIKRAINFFKEYDEFWWEVNGHEWDVSMHKVSAKVVLPPQTPMDKVDAKCFFGEYGSTAQGECLWTTYATYVMFETGYTPAKNGLSIAIKLPKGVIMAPSSFQKALWFLSDNFLVSMILILPLTTLLIMTRLWLKTGRDPMHGQPIMVRYDPPTELIPAEVGTVLDESVDMSDITATIVDLAVRGYVKIVEMKSEKILFFTKIDYALIQLKDFNDGNLNRFERQLMQYIFDIGKADIKIKELLNEKEAIAIVTISNLREKFYDKIPILKDIIYEELVRKNYFPGNPQTTRTTWRFLGVGILSIAFILGFFIVPYSIYNLSLSFGLGLSGIIVIIFSFFMPRKTRKGAAAFYHSIGFKEFVVRAEKDRIERMAQEDPTIFERLLPYAMVLGVADMWVEKFRDIFKEPPGWYVSQQPLDSMRFINSLGRAVSFMNSSVSSRPRGASSGGSSFSGGGFSGGGFGGGGGGAW